MNAGPGDGFGAAARASIFGATIADSLRTGGDVRGTQAARATPAPPRRWCCCAMSAARWSGTRACCCTSPTP